MFTGTVMKAYQRSITRLSFKEAMDSKDLEMGYGGMAIVKKEGDSYKLKYYKIY